MTRHVASTRAMGRRLLARLVLLSWLVLLVCAMGTPAWAQEAPAGAHAQPPWEQLLADHRAWLAELGDPQLLDLMGLQLIQPSQRDDSRRLALRNANLRAAPLAGALLRASDLSGSDLSEARLAGADAAHAVLAGTIFTRAVLDRARLVRADLSGATLRDTSLVDADLTGAQLAGADLRGANLIGANLSNANLIGANLTQANLNGAVLAGADLSQARIDGADLHGADLSNAQLFGATLSRARLTRADLTGAQLHGVDFSDAFLAETRLREVSFVGARLHGTNLFANDLTGTDLRSADLSGVIFEPPPERLAEIEARLTELTRATNLGRMTFFNNPEPLETLRRMFTRQGFRQEQIEITYAIRRGQRQRAASEGSIGERLGSILQWVFVEFPIEYGAAPFRPVLLVFVLIVVFGLAYMAALVWPSPYWGELWRIRPRDPFSRRMGDAPLRTRIHARRPSDLGPALWFSFLSALNIGGRVFNVDDLFINCQREEYYLRATGWARTLSGVQALITLYLLLLTLLIFFEKVTF